jgi:hypothetical protein
MQTLIFTNPHEVLAYWDKFEDRSIRPIQPYLWQWKDESRKGEPTITPIRRNELDLMIIDEKTEEIQVDPAIYTVHQNNEQVRNVLVLSHTRNPDSEYAWDVEVLVALFNQREARNLIQQIEGEATQAFKAVQ